MDILFKKFANMTEYHTYLEEGVVQPAFEHYQASQSGSQKFTGTADYTDADKLYMFGDKKNAKKINEKENIKMMIKKYAATKPTTKKFVCVAGAVPHVPNFIAGVPTNMVMLKRVKVKERVMDVFFNMAIPCYVETETIIKTTVELFKAIMTIESNGTRVNLYVGECVRNSRNTQVVGMAIKIKHSTQPIDIEKMVYPLVNPSMLRRHHFRFMEVTEGVEPDFNDGYGRVSDKAHEYAKKEMRGVHCVSFEGIKNMNCESIVREILDN